MFFSSLFFVHVLLVSMCVSCVCRYNEDLELEDAIHTAILALKVRQTGRQQAGEGV